MPVALSLIAAFFLGFAAERRVCQSFIALAQSPLTILSNAAMRLIDSPIDSGLISFDWPVSARSRTTSAANARVADANCANGRTHRWFASPAYDIVASPLLPPWPPLKLKPCHAGIKIQLIVHHQDLVMSSELVITRQAACTDCIAAQVHKRTRAPAS